MCSEQTNRRERTNKTARRGNIRRINRRLSMLRRRDRSEMLRESMAIGRENVRQTRRTSGLRVQALSRIRKDCGAVIGDFTYRGGTTCGM
jgi:hypothetical protein